MRPQRYYFAVAAYTSGNVVGPLANGQERNHDHGRRRPLQPQLDPGVDLPHDKVYLPPLGT